MKSLKVQCPAKINLDLKVINKREDGFHNIESVMQTIDLYDFLTINVENSDEFSIALSGNNQEIPYDEHNLVYKAIKLFIENVDIKPVKISVYIDKNIPIAAGLAGGSTDAAGTLYGLNKIFDNKLSNEDLHQLCAKLGSDLNVCLQGGCLLTSGRGEKVQAYKYNANNVSLIKPLNLGISAKEAYTEFANKIANHIDIEERSNYINDLEWAMIKNYAELQQIKAKYPKSVMTGSGSTYFLLNSDFEEQDGYWVKNGLKTIQKGVEII